MTDARRPKSPSKILEEANALAAEFYGVMGKRRPNGFRFDQATHPEERMCWNFAKVAYDHLAATDLYDVLADLEDD